MKLKNQNFPKCVSCLATGCEAGKVNHNVDEQGYRTQCLLCNCSGYVESQLSQKQLVVLKENRHAETS